MAKLRIVAVTAATTTAAAVVKEGMKTGSKNSAFGGQWSVRHSEEDSLKVR
jgi:hypothetical protein